MVLLRPVSLLLLVVSLGLGGPRASATTAPDAASFIKTLISQGLQTLNEKNLSPQVREQRFHKILEEDFDVPRISRFVLGRYWNTASEPEREAFTKTFQQWVIRAYATRFSEYSGDEVQVKVTGDRAESDANHIVTSQVLRPNAPPAHVDWRVRKQGNDYKIVDVDVEGVSMALTQREEFASVIQRNGGTVAGLTKALEQRIASGDTSAAPLPTVR
jgi:phospholipid transport system substrate-binding protein